MKFLVTGMNGTVAPALAQALAQAGHSVTAWNRSAVSVDDPETIRRFIASEQPDGFFHVAMGSPRWAEDAARTCAELAIRFCYVSSVSVYSNAQTGPFTTADLPEPNDDYGRYKLECERRVQAVHPEAWIARLGWQIGTAPGGNHMVDYLERTFRERGQIDASLQWFPACSFLADMAQALVQLIPSNPAGLYHLDGNPGLNFHDVASGLNRLHGDRWKIVPGPAPIQNNRMLDPRVPLRSIARAFG